MVSVAILGIALTVVMQLFSGGLTSAEKSGEYTKGVLYAKDKMDELLSSLEFLPGEYSGDFPEKNYRWRVEIKPATLSAGDGYKDLPGDIYELALKVYWMSAGKERSIELNTLKYVSKTITENAEITQ